MKRISFASIGTSDDSLIELVFGGLDESGSLGDGARQTNSWRSPGHVLEVKCKRWSPPFNNFRYARKSCAGRFGKLAILGVRARFAWIDSAPSVV
jgi:hypothetical protein